MVRHHPPAKGEVSTHLKRVVLLLLRLWQRSAACNFSSIEVDGRHAPHLQTVETDEGEDPDLESSYLTTPGKKILGPPSTTPEWMMGYLHHPSGVVVDGRGTPHMQKRENGEGENRHGCTGAIDNDKIGHHILTYKDVSQKEYASNKTKLVKGNFPHL